MSKYDEEMYNEHLRRFYSMPMTPIKAKEPDTIWNTITNIKPNDIINISAMFLSVTLLSVFIFKWLKTNKNNTQSEDRLFSNNLIVQGKENIQPVIKKQVECPVKTFLWNITKILYVLVILFILVVWNNFKKGL